MPENEKDESDKQTEVEEEDTIICPNCNSRLDREDVLAILFSKATIMACPVCTKTIMLQPKDF